MTLLSRSLTVLTMLTMISEFVLSAHYAAAPVGDFSAIKARQIGRVVVGQGDQAISSIPTSRAERPFASTRTLATIRSVRAFQLFLLRIYYLETNAACGLADRRWLSVAGSSYSDHDEAIFNATRPLVFNAISELGTAMRDFLDRVLDSRFF